MQRGCSRGKQLYYREKGLGMKRIICVLLFLGILNMFGCSKPSNNPDAEAKVPAAAKAWLALVDSGQYANSWDEAASFFRGAVSKEKWVEMMNAERKPFGKNISRKLKSKHYRTSFPGAPDGEYVVIQFNSSFENKKSAVEPITPMLDKDGMWRVSGYYMK
jgi:hypothetical protein